MEHLPCLHLRPRLLVAADMLRGSNTVADIGCDHGRLSCALIQQGEAERVIGVDISQSSLQKAQKLVARTGMTGRVELRLGDGFKALAPGEADAVAMLGMGGTLMARLLANCRMPANGAERLVLQPMCGAGDIRQYLYENGYPISDDRVVEDSGRLYQVFCAGAPMDTQDALPAGWPENCYLLGYRAFEKRDPLLLALARRMLDNREKRLKNTSAPKLLQEAAQLRQILAEYANRP